MKNIKLFNIKIFWSLQRNRTKILPRDTTLLHRTLNALKTICTEEEGGERERGGGEVKEMKWHQLKQTQWRRRSAVRYWDKRAREQRVWPASPRLSLHPPLLFSFIHWSDSHTHTDTHTGWMVVIRTSVRSLQASSGLRGWGHYHWVISCFWTILAALRISHFYTLTLTHTHIWAQLASARTIGCHLGMIAAPLYHTEPGWRGQIMRECVCGWGSCDWVLSYITRPLATG